MVQDFEEKIWEKEEEARTQDSSLVRLLLGGFGALGVLDADDLLLALHQQPLTTCIRVASPPAAMSPGRWRCGRARDRLREVWR